MNVSLESAESLKISAGSPGASPDPVLTRIIQKLNDQLVSEIRMTIEFFLQSADLPFVMPALSNIFLTGGCSRVLGIDSQLSSALKTAVSVINPFQNIAPLGSGNSDKILEQSHIFGTAVGLALRKMG